MTFYSSALESKRLIKIEIPNEKRWQQMIDFTLKVYRRNRENEGGGRESERQKS